MNEHAAIAASDAPDAPTPAAAERYSPLIIFSVAVSMHTVEIIRLTAALSFGAGPRSHFVSRLDDEFSALNVAWRTFRETERAAGAMDA